MEPVVWGLLLVRWLIPTEGTAEGDTLWLTSLTLAVAAGFCWWNSRVCLQRFRFAGTDLAVCLFCGAHVLASLQVILTEGNKRAATNMLWEWVGVAVTFSLLRQTISPQTRNRFVRTILVTTTALACYGLWQPMFWYPSNVREYESLRAELDSVESAPGLSPQERATRQQVLRAEFVSQGIPLSGPSQQLFERRLRDSQEPLGFFALANTFAGFMAVSLVLLSGAFLHQILPKGNVLASGMVPHRNRWLTALIAVAMLLAAYCLILTKSRTAWGGTLVGLAVLVCLMILATGSRAAMKKILPILGAGVAALVVLMVLASATGALDIEVLSEASTSLSYRLEYWASTWEVIQDHPILGTGPGNFRDHYLQYKLPQSSEEIADPHQFVLDVAANAGVVGVIGLLAVLAMIARLAWKLCCQLQNSTTGVSIDGAGSGDSPETGARGAITVAVVVTMAGAWLFSGTVSWLVLCVGLLAIGIDFLITLVMKASPAVWPVRGALWKVPSVAVVAAVIAMFVHLSAAGGIAMPAVAGLLFALVAVLQVDCLQSECADQGGPDTEGGVPLSGDSPADRTNRQADIDGVAGRWLGTALLAGLTAVGCTLTAFGPVIRATSLMQLGDYEAVNGQPLRQVVGLYRSAAEADSLSSEPHIRLSQFYLHHWLQSQDDDYFKQAIEHAGKARSISPDTPHITHEIGHAWLMRAIRSATTDGTAITAAVDELKNALEMYPTHPAWNAELAQALVMAGETAEAADVAQQALELDRLNRAAGHSDRYLPEEQLNEIRRIAEASPGTSKE